MQIYSCKNIPNSSQEKMQSIIEAISVSYSPNRFDHPVLTFFMAKIGLSSVLDDTLLFLAQGWRSSNCAWSIKWAQSLWKFNISSFHFKILEFSLGCKVCKCVLCNWCYLVCFPKIHILVLGVYSKIQDYIGLVSNH